MGKIKQIRKKYLENKIRLEKWQKFAVFCLLVVCSGLIGWLIEFIFYFFNSGLTEFNLQGGNFLPWINIYAFGAILIVVLAEKLKLKKKPIFVFLVSMIATGALEYVAGWLIFNLGNGERFWNYNTEIWNFGNIDGFICLRSVVGFGVAALGLIYLLMPLFIFLVTKMNRTVFRLVVTIFVVVMIDEIYNSILTRIVPGLPNAVEIYQSIGLKYVEVKM